MYTASTPLVSSPCLVMRFFSLPFLGSHRDGALLGVDTIVMTEGTTHPRTQVAPQCPDMLVLGDCRQGYPVKKYPQFLFSDHWEVCL